MPVLWNDLKYTLRQLRNAPVWALTAVLTLALGLGAVTAMLAIVDSVLIQPVALPHPDRLVSLTQLLKRGSTSGFELHETAALEKVSAFQSLAVSDTLHAPITTRDGSRIDLAAAVNPGYFRAAGVAPHLGRVLTATDAHTPVAVVNDRFWQDRLHGDPHALGSSIKIKDRLLTIVGIMPPGFSLDQIVQGPTVYTLLSLTPGGEDANGNGSFGAVTARLKPGVTREAAQAEAQAVHARQKPVYREYYGKLILRPYQELMTEDEKPSLLAILGACMVLLLIACFNAANLQIARGVSRTGEMNVRAALGASRGRLVRQIVTESVTVSYLGAVLGLLFASAAVAAVRSAYQLEFARFNELALNPRVFALCALLAVVAGVLAALAPAWNAVRTAGSLQATLASRVTRRSRVSGLLVAGEVALTLALLVTAGLFICSYRYLADAPFGFNAHHVTGIVLMPNVQKEPAEAQKATEERLLGALRALPGVSSAAFQMSQPYSRYLIQWQSGFHFAGQPTGKDAQVLLNVASTQLGPALGMRLREGRSFEPGDSAGTGFVCLANEAFARRYLAGRTAVGRVVALDHRKENDKDPLLSQTFTVVGVLADEVAFRSPPALYLDAAQIPAASDAATWVFGATQGFLVRSPLPQATVEREVRAALKQAAPDFAEVAVGPLSENIQVAFTQQRLALRLASGFGFLALALAAVGIYGVLASSVAQRTREIGIRMALGATREQAGGLVLRQAAAMVLLGAGAGLVCAWPAGRAVKAYLYGVKPLDPLTLALAAAVLLLVCALAAAVPAWRATQVDPVIALRSE